ncbi:MAG: hypothetical protein ACREB3_07240 [Burkholderiales bacterium]
MAGPPKLVIPTGTIVGTFLSRVTIDFLSVEDANNFCAWLKWLDEQSEPKDLVLIPGEKTKVQ